MDTKEEFPIKPKWCEPSSDMSQVQAEHLIEDSDGNHEVWTWRENRWLTEKGTVMDPQHAAELGFIYLCHVPRRSEITAMRKTDDVLSISSQRTVDRFWSIVMERSNPNHGS